MFTWGKALTWLTEKKIFVAILLLAFIIRVPLLQGSFWLDEAAQALESTRPLSQQLSLAADFQPPLYHLVVYGLSFFSQSEWWLRLASLIPGLGSIALTMYMAHRWWGKTAMGAAGLLMATSSLHTFFSQELRPYMLAVCLCLLSLTLLDIWGSEQLVLKRHWKRIGVLGVVVALTLYTSYVALFWWPAVVVATCLYKRHSAGFVFLAGIVAAVLFLPWGVTGLRDQLAVGSALRETLPGWDAVVSFSSYKAIPLVLAKFLVGVEVVDFTWQYGVLLAVPYLSLAALSVWSLSSKKEVPFSVIKRITWLGLLFTLPLVFAWVFSLITPVIAPKRVLYLLPILYLFISGFFAGKKKGAFIVFIFFMTANIWSLGRYWTDPQLQRENWKQAALDIEQQFPPSTTVVIMSLDEPLAPWRWYTKNSYRVVSTGLAPLQSAGQLEELIRPHLNVKTILVFDYLRDLSDPYKVTEAALLEAGYQEKGVLEYPQIGFVRVYMQDKLYAGVAL